MTARFGGNYGVMRCANLLPELLDAYETRSEGEVSQPFETAVGMIPAGEDRTREQLRLQLMAALLAELS
jgi:hypothetical protein